MRRVLGNCLRATAFLTACYGSGFAGMTWAEETSGGAVAPVVVETPVYREEVAMQPVAPAGHPGRPPATIPETEVEASPPTAAPTFPETQVEANQPTTVPSSNEPLGTGAFGDPFAAPSEFDNPIVQGYRAETQTAGTLLSITDRLFPGTANVITRDLLNDQQDLRIQDVIRNAGGVNQTGGNGFFADSIFLRGLELGSRDFRKDGFLDPTYVPRDFQNVERVEILKGPASVLYGAGNPAGMVNLITKKPLDMRFSTFGFTFGSYGQQRYTVDANGWATESHNVLYRLNVAHEDVNSFVDFNYLSRTQISPTVTWKINDETTLNWSGEWHRDRRIGFQGTPAINGDPLALPPSRYAGQPANDFIHTEEFRQSLTLTRQISDTWTFRLGGNSLFYSYPSSVTSATNIVPPPSATDFFQTRADFNKAQEQSQSVIANLGGEMYTGEIKHKVLAGMEYVYFNSNTNFSQSLVGVPFSPLSMTNPIYLNPPAFPTLLTADIPKFQQQRVGGYLQDYADLTPHWKALAGVRFDTVNFQFDRNLNIGFPLAASSTQNFNHVTPRAGLIFQPWADDDSLTGYFNYSQSFGPPASGIYLNPTLKAVTGESYEAGFKTELLPGLTLNAAAFHITRMNSESNSPGNPFLLVQVARQRSQGVEMNLLGQVTERMNVVANYTYADTLLSDPDPLFNNKRQRNIPFNTANFWTRYNLIQNETHTLGAALGLVYVDSRAGNIANTLFLPGYGRWDAGFYYSRGRMNASVYLENLFDLQYAASSINELQIYQGAPFNGRATIALTF